MKKKKRRLSLRRPRNPRAVANEENRTACNFAETQGGAGRHARGKRGCRLDTPSRGKVDRGPGQGPEDGAAPGVVHGATGEVKGCQKKIPGEHVGTIKVSWRASSDA